jgi:hypothetical protein
MLLETRNSLGIKQIRSTGDISGLAIPLGFYLEQLDTAKEFSLGKFYWMHPAF